MDLSQYLAESEARMTMADNDGDTDKKPGWKPMQTNPPMHRDNQDTDYDGDTSTDNDADGD